MPLSVEKIQSTAYMALVMAAGQPSWDRWSQSGLSMFAGRMFARSL